MSSMERKGRKRKRSVNDDVHHHVRVEVGEDSLLNISNVSDLSEELELAENNAVISDEEVAGVDDEFTGVGTLVEDVCTNSRGNFVNATEEETFSHVRFENALPDIRTPNVLGTKKWLPFVSDAKTQGEQKVQN